MPMPAPMTGPAVARAAMNGALPVPVYVHRTATRLTCDCAKGRSRHTTAAKRGSGVRPARTPIPPALANSGCIRCFTMFASKQMASREPFTYIVEPIPVRPDGYSVHVPALARTVTERGTVEEASRSPARRFGDTFKGFMTMGSPCLWSHTQPKANLADSS